MARSPTTPVISELLCFNLYTTSLKMTQLYKSLLSDLNLTYPQYLVMVVLWEHEGIGIKELGAKLHQESGSVVPIVKRLEAQGYLIRSRDPLDERNRVLTLTQAGQDLRIEGARVNACIIQSSGLSLDSALRMMADLQALNKNLDI